MRMPVFLREELLMTIAVKSGARVKRKRLSQIRSQKMNT